MPKPKNYQELVALYDATLENLTIPYQTRMVETSFGNTHVVTAGETDASPVLVLHSAASNAVGCWPIINSLASNYFVFAPDAPRQLGKTENF